MAYALAVDVKKLEVERALPSEEAAGLGATDAPNEHAGNEDQVGVTAIELPGCGLSQRLSLPAACSHA